MIPPVKAQRGEDNFTKEEDEECGDAPPKKGVVLLLHMFSTSLVRGQPEVAKTEIAANIERSLNISKSFPAIAEMSRGMSAWVQSWS